MSSPEYIFHQQCVVFAPDDKTVGDASGQTGAEDPQHEDPWIENFQSLDVGQLARLQIIGKEGFNWRENLSANGQWLYELLIGEQGDTELLTLYALEEGKDLDAALTELRQHGLIDESNSSIIRIIRHH
jgi:hypothetical protein